MPNVSLDVRNFPSNGSDGYTDTTASNNATYSYLYGGGSDGRGDMTETIGASSTFTVTVGSDPRYKISNVELSGGIVSQLSWQPGTPATTITITDTDSAAGSGYYSIIVTDTTANCTFPCDPRIENIP